MQSLMFLLCSVMMPTASLAAAATTSVKSLVLGQTPFLYEILQGRCFERPFDGGADPYVCPDLVDSLFWELLNDQQDIRFQRYFENADCSADDGLLWIGDSRKAATFGLSTPSRTPCGSSLAGLNVCGNGIKDSCINFWEGAYQHFAKQLTGSLTIIVQDVSDKDSLSLVHHFALPNLSPSVKTVNIFVSDPTLQCSHKIVQNLQVAASSFGATVRCTLDPSLTQFWLCGSQDSMSCDIDEQEDEAVAPSEPEERSEQGPHHHASTPEPTSKAFRRIAWLVIPTFFAGLAFYVYQRRRQLGAPGDYSILLDDTTKMVTLH